MEQRPNNNEAPRSQESGVEAQRTAEFMADAVAREEQFSAGEGNRQAELLVNVFVADSGVVAGEGDAERGRAYVDQYLAERKAA